MLSDKVHNITPIEIMMENVEWQPVPPPENTKDSDFPYITHTGQLIINGNNIKCHRLSNGERVMDAKDVEIFFGIETK